MRGTHSVIHRCHTSGNWYPDYAWDIFTKYHSTNSRCHAGDVYYTFGNLIRQGQPQRDDIDLPFSQLIVDLYASFARNYTPNPSLEYLRARDYDSTLQQIDRPGGCWEPVKRGEDATLRRLDWPSSQAVFNEVAQCKALGLPLDYFTD